MRNQPVLSTYCGIMALLLTVCMAHCQRIGVSHISITVSDINQSLLLYRNMLGGMVIQELSSLSPVNDSQYIEAFLPESNAESTNSIQSVSWVFLQYDNTMVHLVQYHDEEASDDIAGNARSSPLSKFSQPAVAFWLKDGTNFTEYAHELEKSAQTHGLQQVKFMRPLLMSSTANDRVANEGVRKLRDNDLKGLSIGYLYGPDGEAIKFIQLVGASREKFSRHYCLSNTVSTALLDAEFRGKCDQFKSGLTSQLYGINHISLPVQNPSDSLEFYEKEFRAYTIDDIQPTDLRSASLDMIFAQMSEMMKSMSAMKYKVPEHDSSTSPPPPAGKCPDTDGDPSADQKNEDEIKPRLPEVPKLSLNLRYQLLGNIKLEFVSISGLPKAMVDRMAAMTADNFQLPNRPGQVIIHLGVQDIEELSNASSTTPELDDCEITEIESGHLAGYRHCFIDGPEGVTIGLSEFTGQAKRLRSAMRLYGAVSFAYPELNPFLYQGYDKTCSPYHNMNDDN